MSNLKITRHQREMPFNSFVFPSGEIGVKIDVKNSISFIAKTGVFAPADYQTIVARLKNSNDIIELFMLVNALRELDDTPINLFLTKVPYAQQDRICDLGESFSLKVFGDLINSLNFNKVTIIDPHSDVTRSVINKIKIIKQFDIVNAWPEFIARILDNVTFLSPDSGANKKVSEIASFFGKTEFIRADKLRNLSTGKIIETIVYADDLKGQDVCIPDDICLGGATFTEIAKVLRKKNVGKIILFVTHGVFSNGLCNLLNNGVDNFNGVDEIWTTNSFRTDLTPTERLHIFDVEKFLF